MNAKPFEARSNSACSVFFAVRICALAVRVAPLHDVVVLRAHEGEAVEVAFTHESNDVGDVLGRELRRQLDDDAAGRQLEI